MVNLNSRVESDRATVIARVKAERLEERRVRKLLGVEGGNHGSSTALKAHRIGDAAEEKLKLGAPPLMFAVGRALQ